LVAEDIIRKDLDADELKALREARKT